MKGTKGKHEAVILGGIIITSVSVGIGGIQSYDGTSPVAFYMALKISGNE